MASRRIYEDAFLSFTSFGFLPKENSEERDKRKKDKKRGTYKKRYFQLAIDLLILTVQ